MEHKCAHKQHQRPPRSGLHQPHTLARAVSFVAEGHATMAQHFNVGDRDGFALSPGTADWRLAQTISLLITPRSSSLLLLIYLIPVLPRALSHVRTVSFEAATIVVETDETFPINSCSSGCTPGGRHGTS